MTKFKLTMMVKIQSFCCDEISDDTSSMLGNFVFDQFVGQLVAKKCTVFSQLQDGFLSNKIDMKSRGVVLSAGV